MSTATPASSAASADSTGPAAAAALLGTPTFTAKQRIGGAIRLLRPKQWVKNAFVLAPIMFAGLFTDLDAILAVLAATAMFCAASSAVYIVNDLHDRERDRAHPVKSLKRPLASGAVTVPTAIVLLVLLLAGLGLVAPFMPQVALVVGGYLLLNLAYTFWLKHQPVLDIFTIAIGFVLRVLAGATALEVHVSSWMFITTLCLALYLAAIKRRQEFRHESARQSRTVLRAYSVELVERYAEMAATGALVFYSLFVVSEQEALVVTIPIVLFGLFRYWYITQQQERGESPTDALFSDWQLIGAVAVWAGLCVWALAPAELDLWPF